MTEAVSATGTAVQTRTRPSKAHLLLLGALYTAQGLPFGFFTLALPVLLRDAGWSLAAIALLQFLALPWAIKFLWAPWLDHHGARRTWLLALQGTACALALLMSQVPLAVGSPLLLGAVFLFNTIAASQDVITDGLAVRLLGERERGLANALQVGAYRLGMILGGGFLLWMFAHSNWSTTYLCMAALLGLTSLPVLFMREPARTPPPSDLPRGRALALSWLTRALTPGLLSLAMLIFCFRFGDQILGTLITPFLRDQGIDKATIALMKGTVGSATSLVGALLGGWLTFRTGRRRALLWSGLAQSAGFGLYVAAAFGLGGLPVLWAATVVEGIVGTMATVALFTLMMDASDPAYAGTDYTILASIVVAVGSLGGITGGLLADTLGYGWTFAIGTVLSAAGCLALVGWLDRHPVHPRVARAWR